PGGPGVPGPGPAGRYVAVRDGAPAPSRWSGRRGCYLAAGPGAARHGGPAAGRERGPVPAAGRAEARPAGRGAAPAGPGAGRTGPEAPALVPRVPERPAAARPRERPVRAPAK